MTTEGTPATGGQEQGGEAAPDLSVWNDTTRDAIVEKYGSDINSLAKGYFNSQAAFNKAGESASSMSSERADFVQQRQEWEAERVGHASALEAANSSAVTAADVNKNIFGAVQDDLVAHGEVQPETRKAMLEMFDNDEAFVERNIRITSADVNERLTAAQEFAPKGTDVKALLAFYNEDVVKTEGSLFSAEEAAYYQSRADKGDYGFVAQVEERYLASIEKSGEKQVKAAKAPVVGNSSTTRQASGDSFDSQVDYDKAKSDKRYQVDFQYRQEVDRKYRNSDVQAMADAKMEAMFGPGWDTTGPIIREG